MRKNQPQPAFHRPDTARLRSRSTAVAAASFLLITGAALTLAPAAHAGAPGSTSAADRLSIADIGV